MEGILHTGKDYVIQKIRKRGLNFRKYKHL